MYKPMGRGLMAARRLSCVPIVGADGRVHGMVSENRLLDVLRGGLAGDTHSPLP